MPWSSFGIYSQTNPTSSSAVGFLSSNSEPLTTYLSKNDRASYPTVRHSPNVSKFFAILGLKKIQFMPDGKMGGNYYRVFTFFENDDTRYFATIRVWDLQKPFAELLTGDVLTIHGKEWKASQENIEGIEVVSLEWVSPP